MRREQDRDTDRQRLEALQFAITRQRASCTTHQGISEVLEREWHEILDRHDRNVSAILPAGHVVERVAEDLRFDIEIVLHDVRMFIAKAHHLF